MSVTLVRNSLYAPLALTGWLTIGLMTCFIGPTSPELGTSLLGLSAAMFGTIAFLEHGANRLTPTGVFMLAFAIFVGIAAISAVGHPVYQVDIWTWRATAYAYFTTVLIYAFSLHNRGEQPLAALITVPADASAIRWSVKTGLGLMGLALIVTFFGIDNLLSDAAAFVGLLLVTTALWRMTDKGLGVLRTTVAAGGFLVYMTYIFDGFGRLTLAALAVGLATTASHRWRGRRLKLLALAAVVPALVYFSRARAEFSSSLNPARDSSFTGFESAITPLLSFGELLRLADDPGLEEAWGSTFWAAMVALVPRAAWEGKPIGFGALLTELLHPELAGTGHSDLALLHGEWLYNFGAVGMILMVPVVGLALRLGDNFVLRGQRATPTDGRGLLKLVGAAIIVGGMVDLVWGGTFTFASRAGSRLVVLASVFLLLKASGPITEREPRREQISPTNLGT